MPSMVCTVVFLVMSQLLCKRLGHLEPCANDVHILFGCCDSALALFLEAMQDKHRFRELDRVDRAISAPDIVLDNLYADKKLVPMIVVMPNGSPQGPRPGTVLAGTIMKRADADKNGVVSREEFLAAAEAGKATDKPLVAGAKLETRDSDKAYYFETARTSASASAPAWIHRNYLAK